MASRSQHAQCMADEVYAPCHTRLDHGQTSMEAQREAYEAAAMGPRGACLKEEQGRSKSIVSPKIFQESYNKSFSGCLFCLFKGAQLRCWSDRESGTIALCFDASGAHAGLLASLTWKLQPLAKSRQFS